MNFPLRRLVLSPWVWMLVAVALSFSQHWHFLHLPFPSMTPASDEVGLIARGPLTWSLFWRSVLPAPGQFYRPTFLVLFAALLRGFGASTIAFHTTSLVLHGVVAGAFALLVRRLTNSAKVGALAGGLFVFCPWNYEEAIWWGASSSSLLAALFLLITLSAWLSFRQSGMAVFYYMALASLALSLMSKEDAAIAPLVFIAFDVAIRAGEKWGRTLICWAPFALVSLGYVVLQRMSAGHFQTYYANDVAQGSQSERVAHLFLRFPLVLRFADTLTQNAFGFYPLTLGSLLVVAALLVIWRAARFPTEMPISPGFAPAWALLSLPLFPLTMGKYAFYCPRYAYLPALAISALGAIWAWGLWRNRQGCQTVACVGVGLFLARLIPVPRDPATVWILLFLLVAVAAIGARARLVPVPVTLSVALLALATQADVYLFSLPPGYLALGAALCVCALTRSALGFVFAWAAFTSPLLILPAIVVSYCAQNWNFVLPSVPKREAPKADLERLDTVC